jgi:hypothetical protein
MAATTTGGANRKLADFPFSDPYCQHAAQGFGVDIKM